MIDIAEARRTWLSNNNAWNFVIGLLLAPMVFGLAIGVPRILGVATAQTQSGGVFVVPAVAFSAAMVGGVGYACGKQQVVKWAGVMGVDTWLAISAIRSSLMMAHDRSWPAASSGIEVAFVVTAFVFTLSYRTGERTASPTAAHSSEPSS